MIPTQASSNFFTLPLTFARSVFRTVIVAVRSSSVGAVAAVLATASIMIGFFLLPSAGTTDVGLMIPVVVGVTGTVEGIVEPKDEPRGKIGCLSLVFIMDGDGVMAVGEELLGPNGRSVEAVVAVDEVGIAVGVKLAGVD